MTMSFAIARLDIMQGGFAGRADFRGDRYTVNIQPEKRGKVLRLPFRPGTGRTRFVVRLTGKADGEELVVEDYLRYWGESEWLEIDSDAITYFLADHQDALDTIEIMDDDN